MNIEIQKLIDRALRLHISEFHKETAKGKGFVKPTAMELREYADSIGFHSFNPQNFIDSYTAKGWLVGKNRIPMKDWRATVRTWYQGSSESKKQARRQEVPLKQVTCIVDHEPAQHYSNDKQGKPTWLCRRCAWAFERQIGHRNWGLMSASQIKKIVLLGKAKGK